MFAQSRRKLQSQGRRRLQASRPAGDDDNDAAVELPPYQEPCCPLTADGQRELRELSSRHVQANLQKHADASAKLLASTVFAINERLTNRKDAVEKVVKKRRVNNDEGGQDLDIEAVKASAEELEEEVSPLTLQVEAAMREVLDMQAALQDEKDVLANLPEAVSMAQQEIMSAAMETANDEDDMAPEAPGVPIYSIIEQDREQKKKAYDDLSMFQKYSKTNAYIDFKRNWHDGLYPNDEVPVPNAKTWFDGEGQPQHLTRVDGDGEDDSDNDIQISREKRSFRCPLSLMALTEPYTCRRCKHSFQKEAIYSYLGITGPNSRGSAKGCPESGCDIKDMRKDDLFLDEALLRRIKRAAQLEREEAERFSDREEEEEPEDTVSEAPVKHEATMDEDEIEEDDED